MDVIEFRKVTLEDYDDVISIRNDVYDGLDYLPALYQTLMTNHTGYAVTVNKKIVAFECQSVIDDGETVIKRALRMHKGFEGRGLVYHLRKFVQEDNARKPRPKRSVHTTGKKALVEKSLEEKNGKLVVQKDILFYQGEVSMVIPFLPAVDRLTTRVLNSGDIKKLLSSKSDTDRLFPQGRIIVDWVPYRLLASNVDHFFNDFCYIVGSGERNCERIECITLSVSYTVPSGIRYNVGIYGNFSEETFSDHMAKHLRKCSTFDTEHINFVLHYDAKRHDPGIITKVMHQFKVKKSDNFHSTTMYGVEKPIVPLSKY